MLQFVCHFLTVLVVKDGCFTATGSLALLTQLPNYDNIFKFVLDPQPHLSHGVNSHGRTYGEHPYHPGHLSPPGLVSLPVPSAPVLLSCILHQVHTLPCLSVLYIYPNQVSSLSLPFLPVIRGLAAMRPACHLDTQNTVF